MYHNFTAELTLERARYFLSCASVSSTKDREAFSANLEAAIIYGRSVTFHLQKELKSRTGFDSWYETQQERLARDPTAHFLLTQRNFALKEGPIPTRRVMNVSAVVSISIQDEVTVTVRRGKPWRQRPIHILWEDSVRPIKVTYKRLKDEWKALLKKALLVIKQDSERNTVTHDAMYFMEPEFANVPAVEVIDKYFNLLQEIVDEAGVKF